MAQTHGIGDGRLDEVLDSVGLTEVARDRAGSFSLGMAQRLVIATALLGDPHTIILDEPSNGPDPEGILWIRDLLKRLAGEGRTVFLSACSFPPLPPVNRRRVNPGDMSPAATRGRLARERAAKTARTERG